MTHEEILYTISAARDSVWVINDTIARIDAGENYSESFRDTIQRNVAHLNIIVSSSEIIESGEDISDLHEAISAGEAKIAEYVS